jgi:hypothetical protein
MQIDNQGSTPAAGSKSRENQKGTFFFKKKNKTRK